MANTHLLAHVCISTKSCHYCNAAWKAVETPLTLNFTSQFKDWLLDHLI